MIGHWFFHCVFVIFCSSISPSVLFPVSSFSDYPDYNEVCLKASQDQSYFSSFKRLPIYNGILEHVTYEQGREYLDIVLQQSPEFLSKFDLFRQNDVLGNPLVDSYGSFGIFSPTTLRYVKVASDLKKHFGSLDNLHIVEIGGGYGGQCTVLSKLFNFASYTIIDLPNPLALTEKYLKTLGIENVVFKKPEEVLKNQSYDLVISNYAFSECVIPVQEAYLEKVLLVSTKGYLTCNYHYALGGVIVLTENEFLQKLKGGKIECRKLVEVPLTAPNNYIVVWN